MYNRHDTRPFPCHGKHHLKDYFGINIGTESYKLVQQAMYQGLCIPLKFLKFVVLGPPGAGKTSFMRRLIGEIEKIIPDCEQPSTLTAYQRELIIKETAFINAPFLRRTNSLKLEWCSISENEGECSLDTEALIIYSFINDRFQNSSESDRLSTESDNISQSPPLESLAERNATAKSPPKSQDLIPSTVTSNGSDDLNPKKINSSVESYETSDSNDDQTEIASNEGPVDSTFLARYKDVFDGWKTLLAESKYDQIAKVLSQTTLVNIIDMGGQPPFLEMVPALAHGPGLYLICFNLQNEIDRRYDVAYITDDHKLHKLQYSYSVLEVLFHCLSSIACFSLRNRSNQAGDLPIPPPSEAAMIVGTHLDKLKGNAAAVIKSTEDRIKKELLDLLECDRMEEQYYHRSLCKYNGRVLTAVDNTRGVDEIQGHRNHIEHIIRDKFYNESDFPIPASWLMFSIFLRKIERKILSIQECQHIAKELCIPERDVKQVLLHLHHDIGIIMYYASDEVEGLDEDVIICQPQVMFKSIGDLILNVFLPERCPNDHIRNNFWNKGQFRLEDIENSSAVKGTTMDADQLSPKQLLSILQYLNVLVTLQSNVFFMPAIMKAAPKDVLNKHKHCSEIAPLLIRFKCVFVPIGCFTAMIARLVCDQKKNKWRLNSKDDLYKDMITFTLPGNYKAVLISRPKYYEVHLLKIPNSDSIYSVEHVASCALRTMCDTLDSVLNKLKERYTSPNLTIYQLGFICCCKGSSCIPGDGHLMLVDNKSDNKVAQCIESDIQVKLKPAHLVWYHSGSKLLTSIF